MRTPWRIVFSKLKAHLPQSFFLGVMFRSSSLIILTALLPQLCTILLLVAVLQLGSHKSIVERNNHTFVSLMAILLMKPRIHFAFWAASAHYWIVSSFLSTWSVLLHFLKTEWCFPVSNHQGLDLNTTTFQTWWRMCLASTLKQNAGMNVVWPERHMRIHPHEAASDILLLKWKGFCNADFCKNIMEMPGIEPGTSHMRSMCSTTELHPHFWTLCFQLSWQVSWQIPYSWTWNVCHPTS